MVGGAKGPTALHGGLHVHLPILFPRRRQSRAVDAPRSGRFGGLAGWGSDGQDPAGGERGERVVRGGRAADGDRRSLAGRLPAPWSRGQGYSSGRGRRAEMEGVAVGRSAGRH